MKTSIKRNEFSFIGKEEFRYEIENSTYKTERGLRNHLNRLNDKNKEKAERKDIDSVVIDIDWKVNIMGNQAVATMRIYYKDGTSDYYPKFARTNGTGWDKASDVMATCCSEAFSGLLWKKRNTKKNIPNGLSIGNGWFPNCHRASGTGVETFYPIAKFLGGNLEQVANTKKYDKYVFTFK